ncbi:helix-turn-helix transcriptional regulator [Dactylosporangium sucinum]|uniref:DNA-binding transcriptional regulator n=1 Tax=Dactylosporangium sucinum TaxID=1424081 RepID=A0A917UFB4_9ACTN|nr:YafY family protein [Dactylosporangium sucinum]GGM79549.1 DNA-binding transcriptional regulator [Dactylosporangium sucinum]
MLDTSARLLRLLSILQGRAEWSGAELAQRLQVTPRTLRRDVTRLRELGYPVEASPGVAGGYRLGAGSVLPPLLLDDDEAVAVVLSLRTATSMTGVAETSLRALAKLERILPARLRERAAALRQATVPLGGPDPTVDPGMLAVIAEACHSRHRLTFEYRRRDGSRSVRDVEPHRLVHAGRRWYLVAYSGDDWRTFRADRITGMPAPGPRCPPRDPPDAAAFVADAITTSVYRHRARVVIEAPADVVAELVPATTAVVEALDRDRCLLTAGADSLSFLAARLALLGHDFTVLEPGELIEELGLLAGRLQQAYRTSSAPRP